MSSFVLRALIPKTSIMPMGMDLPRSSWVRLIRLKTCIARFQSHVHAQMEPNKIVESPKSYRPISSLCVFYKILERLI